LKLQLILSAGAGKTKLVSSIIDHFCQIGQTDGQPSRILEDLIEPTDLPQGDPSPWAPFAFFYCVRSDEKRRKPGNILRSFLKQLAVSNEESLATFLEVYERKKKQHFLSEVISLAECRKLLIDMLSKLPCTFLILDALDECDEDSRHELIDTLTRLTEGGCTVKVLLSSRPDEDISAEFEDMANFSIRAVDNQEDIIKFVQERIQQYRDSKIAKRRTHPTISAGLEEEIIEVFLDKSQGM
jgi:hypothetical protein